MFKVSEKCTGIFAAKAKLNREEACYASAVKENDVKGKERAKCKMDKTNKYISLLTEWNTAEHIAIEPAVRIANIKDPKKRETIKTQVQRVYETGINPITGERIGEDEITRPIIEYLIAKYDHKPYIPCKWIRLTPERIGIIKHLLDMCDDDASADFLGSLLAVA